MIDLTLAAFNGKSLTRLPVALATALASAAEAGPWPASPQPKNGVPGRSMIRTVSVSGTEPKRRMGYVAQSTDVIRVVSKLTLSNSDQLSDWRIAPSI